MDGFRCGAHSGGRTPRALLSSSPYLNRDRPHARPPRASSCSTRLPSWTVSVMQCLRMKAGEMIQQLATLRGIGVRSATMLVREAFVRDFANGKALGSYAGLSATPYSVVQLADYIAVAVRRSGPVPICDKIVIYQKRSKRAQNHDFIRGMPVKPGGRRCRRRWRATQIRRCIHWFPTGLAAPKFVESILRTG
jgi:hypothetical protein